VPSLYLAEGLPYVVSGRKLAFLETVRDAEGVVAGVSG
jgi:hypothetical protein